MRTEEGKYDNGVTGEIQFFKNVNKYQGYSNFSKEADSVIDEG